MNRDERGQLRVTPVIVISVGIALATGFMIGGQATLGSRAGQVIGPLPTGILMHFAGATVAAMLLLLMTLGGNGPATWGEMNREVWITVTIAGILGIGIVTGSAYSIARIGVAAGIATFVLGQMTVAVVVDSMGWNTGTPIPIDPRRIAGLVVMTIALWLLLPRGD